MTKIRETTIQEQIKEISEELSAAATKLKEIHQGVSIFGSARTKREDIYYSKTIEISKKLVAAGFSIISGGGPGIMEAANKGSYEAGGTSVGLTIKLPFETTNNPYQSHSIGFKYFMPRKTTFFMNSWAYIVMPGGFGTLDEVFEALTLIQTSKANKAPIIFVGIEFWQDLIHFIEKQMVGHGYISPKDTALYTLTDSSDEVVRIVKVAYEENKHNAHTIGLC